GDLRIVVMSFDGPGGKAARNQLIKKLSSADGVELTSRKEATKAGESLGIPKGTTKPAHLAKIGETLGLDAIIMGTVVGEKKLKALEIKIIFTKKPELSITKNYTWTGKTPSSDLMLEVAMEVTQAIRDTIRLIETEAAEAIFGPDDEYETEDKPTKPKKPRPKKGDRGPVIGFDVGMYMSARKLKITSSEGPDIEYDGSVFPAIGADLFFFPGRIASSSPAANIGLGLSFRRSFLLESKLQAADEAFDTSLTVLDARILYQIVSKKAPLVVDVSAGWGLWFYKIDGASQAGIPVVSYEYMNFLVGAAFDIKAVDPWLSIDLGVTLRIPHKWGLGSWTYGDKAAGFGATAVVGLSGPIAVGLGWSAGFEYTGIMTKHSGPCEVTDGTCLTSDKSSDHYLAGFAKLSYAW
ncbi:MAG: hypothetical protein JRG91_14855, partial [Deltaproteobacteria bacterium]|nr:hypothetical protein [Deltaproteobacteria bacterium]